MNKLVDFACLILGGGYAACALAFMTIVLEKGVAHASSWVLLITGLGWVAIGVYAYLKKDISDQSLDKLLALSLLPMIIFLQIGFIDMLPISPKPGSALITLEDMIKGVIPIFCNVVAIFSVLLGAAQIAGYNDKKVQG